MQQRTTRSNQSPLRLGVAGLAHGHVNWLFRRPPQDVFTLVGIAEPDANLAQRYQQQHKLGPGIIFRDLAQMLDTIRPEAVAAFGSIYDHLAVVEACAPRGIHVLVEKPLAVSLDHAQRMAALARQHGIHLLTNYETTWYASTERAYQMVREEAQIGAIRKVVVHDGHRGPQEIGCSADFLGWLTDPVLNGGGAIIDFGCYGANLITWLLNGAKPTAVTAITQQFKPHIYPKVDDEATIILTYPQAQGIIQASWNWAVSRKDMEIYGQTGYVIAPDGRTIRTRLGDKSPEQTLALEPRPAPFHDPFAHLAAVVRGEIVVDEDDLSGLANNLVVVQILDAARLSAQRGQTVVLDL